MSTLVIAILIIIIAALAATFFIYSNKLKKNVANKDKEVENLKKEYVAKLDEYKQELKRQEFILNSYKNEPQKQITPNVAENNNIPDNKLAELNSEKMQLEFDKQKFQEKNKKLWDLSTAIHKEKERIDSLKKEIEHEHREVTDSIKYAKRIQKALLPKDQYIAGLLKEYFIFWKPRDIVSGDFYWFKKIGQYTVIAASDCTGHGVPGAFMSLLGISFLNEVVSHYNILEPANILEELRTLIKESLQQTGLSIETKDGMDMALCVIDEEKEVLKFAGANNHLYYVRNNEMQELKPTKSPVGVHIRELPFVQQELKLEKGDTFYVFSDGYIDQFGGKDGLKFKRNRFKDLLLELNVKKLSMELQKDYLEKTLLEWIGDSYRQIDDILVVGFRV